MAHRIGCDSLLLRPVTPIAGRRAPDSLWAKADARDFPAQIYTLFTRFGRVAAEIVSFVQQGIWETPHEC